MLIIVGGHTRNIGKTSVAAGLISALPEWSWTAMKITQHGHGFCDDHGRACDCAVPASELFAIDEETAGGAPHTDSGRFLAAGARRSFWIRTAVGELGHAMPAVREILTQSGNIIAESNSLMQFVKPDLYIAVLNFAAEDFKDSALRYLDRADALVVLNGDLGTPKWKGVSPGLWQTTPRFPAAAPNYVTRDLADFVSQALQRP
jgi:hypothetical protein